MILFLISSLLPDFDEIKSKISGKFKFSSWLINIFISHRGLLHSVWIPFLIYLFLFFWDMNLAVAASLGYLSHIILDCLTVSGIKILWPLQKKLRGFIKSGGLTEYFIFVLLIIADAYLLIRL
jgi:inner membrane protein